MQSLHKNVGLNEICVGFLVEQNFKLVEQTSRCHVLCEENFNFWSTMVTQLRHLSVVKILELCLTFCLVTKFRLVLDIFVC